MRSAPTKLFSFPNPVNEIAARTVAGGVVLMSIAAVTFDERWIVLALAYGFWARVLTGPRLSPLGQLATRVVAPHLKAGARFVPGPPKRFAQAIGAAFSTTAVILWFGPGWTDAAMAVTTMLAAAALGEAALGYCLGCKVFGLLMRVGVIPEEVCPQCADISLRHPELAR
ncbi:MAG: DUF4395 domain-containing protein [Acidimicrobiales bacterium]